MSRGDVSNTHCERGTAGVLAEIDDAAPYVAASAIDNDEGPLFVLASELRAPPVTYLVDRLLPAGMLAILSARDKRLVPFRDCLADSARPVGA